ncbi:MAG: gliding motility lipoprotein GldD [Prevotellaceae bacterium]|jgi:gliding motility-associated lipoprotein GldD|nr:gliding motility lipoprotein GldD [Prevotellaceae bacterium]
MQKFLIIILTSVLVSCGDAPLPKPYGYFRVALPQHAYRQLGDTLGVLYTFDLPVYTQLTRADAEKAAQADRATDGEQWININYPQLGATIYCYYKPLQNNLYEISEEVRKMVYKHSVRADAIGEQRYEDTDNRVFGVFYDLKGNTASTAQFVLTDSVHHFFRAAVYFNNVPNSDSIAPVRNFVNEDILRMMETFKWKH